MAFQLNLSPELESKLEAYCRETGASKTGAVRSALELLFLERQATASVLRQTRIGVRTNAVSGRGPAIFLPSAPTGSPIIAGKAKAKR